MTGFFTQTMHQKITNNLFIQVFVKTSILSNLSISMNIIFISCYLTISYDSLYMLAQVLISNLEKIILSTKKIFKTISKNYFDY